MNIKLIYWLIISGMIMTGCIHDDTTLGGKTLSEITIESSQDTFQFNFGDEVRIAPVVTQSIEGQELRYEWRSRYQLGTGQYEVDSLKFLPCTDAVLSDLTSFRREGEYTVRLRAYNDDISNFYYFKVFIRSTYDKGLMVLSKNENKEGRLSFLRLLNEGALLNAQTESFQTDVFEKINPGVSLKDPTDMVFWAKNKMILFAQKEEGLYFCDQTLVFLYPITLQKNPGNFDKFYKTGNADNDNPFVLRPGVDLCSIETDALYKAPGSSPSLMKGCFTPLFEYGTAHTYHNTYIDYDQSRLYNEKGENTGTKFEGKEIINMATSTTYLTLVVLRDKEDPDQITISFLQNDKLTPYPGKSDYTYRPTNLTLTKEMDVVCEAIHMNEAFYSSGSKLYRWALSGSTPDLPENPIKTFGADITCMAISNDFRYLYIGLYDPDSPKELKGSVHVMKIADKQIVKEYNNIADRPIKILYKENRN